MLVGPTCDSACEFFAYDTTLQNRASIVGEYPTAGMGGGIDYFILPGGIFFQFTAARAVDPNGNIHIEGKGVQPTVKVPVNEDTLFSAAATRCSTRRSTPSTANNELIIQFVS